MKPISKLRNVYGEPKKEKYNNVKIPETTTDGSLIAVNSNFLSISWPGARGNIAIIDSNTPCYVSPDIPLIRAHESFITDVNFSPFRSDLLATASDDASVKLWEIPQGGPKEETTTELQKYFAHQKRVSFMKFNPCVSEIAASASFDNTMHVWNILKSETISSFEFGDTPTSLNWNYNGSLVGTTTKEKLVYVFDPRSNNVVVKTKNHESTKIGKMCFVDELHFVSCGHNKSNTREMKLFDLRKAENGEMKPICITDMDKASGSITPYFDYDLKLLFLPAKGEANIRYFDLSDMVVKECSVFKSSTPCKAIAMFEKKTMDYNKCEIARFARVIGGDNLEYVSFYVPRKNPGYDPSIYPPVFSGEPALTVDEWMSGENKDPPTKDITECENNWVSAPQTFEKKVEEVKLTPEETIKVQQKKIEELEAKLAMMNSEMDNLKLEVNTYKKKYEEVKAENEELKG